MNYVLMFRPEVGEELNEDDRLQCHHPENLVYICGNLVEKYVSFSTR
jgi:hypothetical protein